MNDATRQRIENVLKKNEVVLFMKGTRLFPQCGFSATVVEVLKRLNAPFHDVNVLSDPEVREGIKVFSNWPTIPQLYIKGEFIGGCDIVVDLFESGDLAERLSTAA